MNQKNIEDLSPLSLQQGSILLNEFMIPNSKIYFEQFYFDMNDGIDPQTFKRAFQEVVNRHSILRTAFMWDEVEEPLKVVYRSVKLPFKYYDWTKPVAGNLDKDFEAFLISDRKQGFVLDQAPLIRCSLIRLSDKIYRFVWSHHHLILNGWGLPVFFKEIFELYDGYYCGRGKRLEDTLPYRSFNDLLMKQDRSSAEGFWRDYLEGIESPTVISGPEIAGEFNDPDRKYEEQSILLSAATSDGLESFVQRHNITLNILLQGAWSILLSRYSGDDNILFGSITSGCPQELPEAAGMTWLFTNILPLRARVNGDDFIVPWFKKIYADNVEKDQYSYCSLSDIQKWSAIPGNMPLFEILFIFNNYPTDSLTSQSGEENDVNSDDDLGSDDFNLFERTIFPLTILAGPGKEITLKIIYDSLRFDSAAISTMLKHWQNLLESLVEDPQGRIREIIMRSEEKIPLELRVRLSREIVSKGKSVKRIIEDIWSDVLGIEKIGMYDNFFMIGGHSLLATQIVSRLKETFSVDLPVQEIFENQTIEEISRKIERIQWAKSGADKNETEDESEVVEIVI